MAEYTHLSLEDWIARQAIPFSLDSIDTLNAAVERMIASIGDGVELLGFGEALHGGNDLLTFRNRLFQRLVEKHGFSAIAIESSFPRGRRVNDLVCGRGPSSYDEVQEVGTSHGFGRHKANRELIEWMRAYNAENSHQPKLHFYGFDSPTEMTGTDSPRPLLRFVLDYLASIDGAAVQARRDRIESLLGDDAAWENPAAMMDPSKSIGLSPQANALRIEAEDLVRELKVRRPEMIAKSDRSRFLETLQYASLARQFLSYHAGLAGTSSTRLVDLLGLRDLMMSENLMAISQRERERGKVFVFAHNSHLQKGQAIWQLGPMLLEWWPAGAQLNQMIGDRYAVIGSAIGRSDTCGIGDPESGTIEASLATATGPALLIPTYQGQRFASGTTGHFTPRSGSATNSTYFPLTSQSLSNFDWLAFVHSLA